MFVSFLKFRMLELIDRLLLIQLCGEIQLPLSSEIQFPLLSVICITFLWPSTGI